MKFLKIEKDLNKLTGYRLKVQFEGCPPEYINVDWKVGCAVFAAMKFARNQVRETITTALTKE